MCNWIYSWYDPKGPINAERLSEIIMDIFARGLGGVRAKLDGFVKSRVHPSIHQGERFIAFVSIRFSVRGAVSNHERKACFGLFTKSSSLKRGKSERPDEYKTEVRK